jgi:citrate synthase
VADGLEGVVVAETRLSHIDGEAGRLVVGGHDVEALAGTVPFESVCVLLWDGKLPGNVEQDELRTGLGQARLRAHRRLDRVGDALEAADPMEALRAAVAHMRSSGDPSEVRLDLTGAMAVFAAAWLRTSRGLPPVEPDPRRGHAADLLRMMFDSEPDPARVAALDTYLVTVADHGMNASTFTARVVASTDSDPVSVVVAALGALKGRLHGGAPGPVLEMLDALGEAEHARPWLEAELAAGRRIMGLGHRVYRVRDPRAAVLERAVTRLEESGVTSGRLGLAREVEGAAVEILRERKPDRPLEANVEFYTAVLLDALGLPSPLFTPVFAVSRVAGWLAHAEEQRAGGRLIRPRARYVGPAPSTNGS